VPRPPGILPFLLLFLFPASLAAQESLLILPFSNASKSHNLDWVGESVSETLLEAFAAQGVTVTSPEDRDQTFREMGVRRYALLTRASVLEVAVNLNATRVVSGEFEVLAPSTPGASKGTLRLTAEILDASKIRRIARLTQAGPLEDLSSLQNQLAWMALQAAIPGLTLSEDEFRRSHPPVRLDAVENYVRGLLATSTDQKHKLLTTAARLAPSYSQPCFQLGKLNLFTLKNYQAAANWLQKVPPTDYHYREALFHLGSARFFTGEFAAASQALRALADIVPLPEVLNNLGAALSRLNDPSAADLFLKAIETDPSDPNFYFNAGYALWRRGNFPAAADQFRAALQRNPDDTAATLMLGRCLKQQPARPGDLRTDALERLKTEYNESAWLALKAMLAPKP
jgi:tetratricopeptide (TPR) repeat protein